MKARFVGDPNDNHSGPNRVTLHGLEFEKNVWRTVDKAVFATHSHFEFDGDEDGEDDPSVEEMKAELAELGVKFHHKAGAAKLAELLAEARAAAPAAADEEKAGE